MRAITHYGFGMKPRQLSKFARRSAKFLESVLQMLAEDRGWQKKRHHPILFYRGMSGVSHATALAIELDRLGISHGQIYVRKGGEDAHGYPVEHRDFDRQNSLFVFVDDFICSGNTLYKCMSTLTDFRPRAGWGEEPNDPYLPKSASVLILLGETWGVCNVEEIMRTLSADQRARRLHRTYSKKAIEKFIDPKAF